MSPHIILFEDISANISFTINSFSSQYARKYFCATPGFWLQHIHSTTCRHGTKNIQPSQLSSNTSDVWRRCPIDIITSHWVFVLVFTFEKLLLLNIQPYFFEIQHNFDHLSFVWPYQEICFKKTNKSVRMRTTGAIFSHICQAAERLQASVQLCTMCVHSSWQIVWLLFTISSISSC